MKSNSCDDGGGYDYGRGGGSESAAESRGCAGVLMRNNHHCTQPGYCMLGETGTWRFR